MVNESHHEAGSDRKDGLLLLVLIPCLNEEATVAEVISQIPGDLRGVRQVKVAVLDDGSTDATVERAEAAGAVVFSNPRNLGLGRTFRRGVEIALDEGADLMVNIDGDGQFNPADLSRLVDPILGGDADMVTASRFIDKSLTPRMPWIKKWGNRWVARIVSIATDNRFRDVSCGFRAFSRAALLRLNLFGDFTYTQETFLDLAYKDLSILEVPVRVQGSRKHGDSRIASNIPRYAYRSARIMFRAAVGYRPLRFFSTIAAGFLALGLGLLGFLFWHYFTTGAFSPHIWSGFVGSSFGFLGILILVIGFLADMLVRIRVNQEELLYLDKRRRYSAASHDRRE